MTELQAWFQPLLWIIATITAIVAFVKLIIPGIKHLLKPAKLEETLAGLSTEISSKLDHFDSRLDTIDSSLEDLMAKVNRNEDVELALLHDAIIQIYHFSKTRDKVFAEDYYRACELYKYNGKSKYIEEVMEALTELWRKSVDNPINQPKADKE